MAKKVGSWWKSLPAGIQKASQIIAAIVAIITAFTASASWLEETITRETNNRIDLLQMEIDSINGDHALSLKRLELMTLISHNPENVTEIERVAYYYFVGLEGDWYMTKIYSEWASEYGGDTTFVKELNHGL